MPGRQGNLIVGVVGALHGRGSVRLAATLCKLEVHGALAARRCGRAQTTTA